MRTLIWGIIAIIAFSMCNPKKADNTIALLIIVINYGDNTRTVSTPWEEGLTSLEALQHVAIVETHPVNEYVFVTAIDSVKGVRGSKAWYYKINRKSSNKLAINQVVCSGDTITWIYKEDVCSKIVK